MARHHLTAASILTLTGRLGDVLEYDGLSIGAALTLARELRRRGSGVVYHLSPAPGVRRTLRDWVFFAGLCGMSVRGLRFGRAFSGLFRRIGPDDSEVARECDRLVEVARASGCSGPSKTLPLLGLTQEAIQWADAELSNLPPGPAPIAIGAGSKMEAKRWPVARFAEVVMRIAEKDPGRTFVLLGGAEEREYSRIVEDSLPGRVLNLCGKSTILESAAVLRRCAIYLGNDTGTMHLAAAMGLGCVAIFSARDFRGRWHPMGTGHRILETRPSCRNCMLEKCADQGMRCLTDIHVPEVTASVFNALKSRQDSLDTAKV